MQKIEEVRRLSVLECFVSNGCNSEFNHLPDEEPVKFGKNRRNMMTTPNGGITNRAKEFWTCWRRLIEVLGRL